jgi:hypothetical protein
MRSDNTSYYARDAQKAKLIEDVIEAFRVLDIKTMWSWGFMKYIGVTGVWMDYLDHLKLVNTHVYQNSLIHKCYVVKIIDLGYGSPI